MNKQIPTPLEPSTLYRAKECARLFGIGVSSWWSWVSEKKVQAPIRLGPRTSVWEGSYLIELRERLIADSKEGATK